MFEYEFRKEIAKFFAPYSDSTIKNLEDLVTFNKKHADKELPERKMHAQFQFQRNNDVFPDQSKQNNFENMLKLNMIQNQFDSQLAILRTAARVDIDKMLTENSIDVILGPSGEMFASLASAADYSMASMPLGFADFNGRAYGVQVLAKAGEENKILRVMNAWEEATVPGGRQPPPLLVNWNDAL